MTSCALIESVGDSPLFRRLPTQTELADIQVLFIAGLETDEARRLSSAARPVGALVNVEGDRDSCGFHVPVIVRQDDLVISISTNATKMGVL